MSTEGSYCWDCGKMGYHQRKQARRAARLLYSPGLREYRCPKRRAYFHNGHIPPAVRRGELTMDEWYALPWTERRRRLDADGVRPREERQRGYGGP